MLFSTAIFFPKNITKASLGSTSIKIGHQGDTELIPLLQIRSLKNFVLPSVNSTEKVEKAEINLACGFKNLFQRIDKIF